MNDDIRRRFDRLEAVRLRIEARIEGIAAETLNRPPAPGRWSAAQVIGHLVLAEGKTVGYVRKKLSDPSQLRPAGLKQWFMGKLVVAVMAAPVRVKAPELVADIPDNEDPNELRRRWAAIRGEMKSLFDSIPDALLGTCLFRHPVAGPMTLAAAIDFMTAHSERHEKQIVRTLGREAKGERRK